MKADLISGGVALAFCAAFIAVIIFAGWAAQPEQVATRSKERAQRAATYEAACERIKCREP